MKTETEKMIEKQMRSIDNFNETENDEVEVEEVRGEGNKKTAEL